MTRLTDTDYRVAATFYDAYPPYRDRADVPFFVQWAKRCFVETNAPVLEIGCGTGRVLKHVAASGVPVVGIDSSERMLRICRAQLRQLPSAQRQATVQIADARRLQLAQRFGLVTLPFRVFQHMLTVADQLNCLGRAHEHLADGGRLIVDAFNPSLSGLTDPDRFVLRDDVGWFSLTDGRRARRLERLVDRDHLDQLLHCEFVYEVTEANGQCQRTTERITLRYFFRHELEHLLARAGFVVEHQYGDYDSNPLGPGHDQELIFVARSTASRRPKSALFR